MPKIGNLCPHIIRIKICWLNPRCKYIVKTKPPFWGMYLFWVWIWNGGSDYFDIFFNIELCSATSMESSRRDLLNDNDRHILKNNQNTYHPRFCYKPKTGIAFAKMFFFLLCKRAILEFCYYRVHKAVLSSPASSWSARRHHNYSLILIKVTILSRLHLSSGLFRFSLSDGAVLLASFKAGAFLH